MGCHTWFYRKAKAKELLAIKEYECSSLEERITIEQAILDNNYQLLREEYSWILKDDWLKDNEYDIVFENFEAGLQYYLEDKYKTHISNVTEAYNNLPKSADDLHTVYHDTALTVEGFLAELNANGFSNYEEYYNYLEKSSKFTFEEFHEYRLRHMRKRYEQISSVDLKCISETDALLLNGLGYTKYGIYEVFKNTIYVDSGFGLNEISTEYGYNIFEPDTDDLVLHDVFRIHDYNLADIRLTSYDECVSFVNDYYAKAKERGIDLYPTELSKSELKDLKKWFDKYPESFVSFG